jgi:hypothetical protein
MELATAQNTSRHSEQGIFPKQTRIAFPNILGTEFRKFGRAVYFYAAACRPLLKNAG